MCSLLGQMKKFNDQTLSAVIGFVSTLALDTVEFWGGITTAAGYLITFQNPIEGYGKFREVIVDPLRETIEENVPDKEAYEGGTGLATGFEIFEAGRGIVKLTSKGVTKIAGKIKGTPSSPIKADIGKVKTVEAGSGSTKMNVIENDIIGKERIGSALKTDSYHNFNNIIDNYAGLATKTEINNGTLYQLEGMLNGVEGRFEWIIQGENVTHRMFVPGGKINGLPIKP